MSELYEAVRGLRAVRAYADEPVRSEDLVAALEVARWTGSAKNTQRWAFVVVTDEEQRVALARTGRYADPIRAAPVAVVLVRLPGGNDFDIGRLAQNLMLGAAARGLATCPVTLHDQSAARAVVAAPADHGVRYAVALGYPTGDTGPRPAVVRGGRRPLDDLVHAGRLRS